MPLNPRYPVKNGSGPLYYTVHSGIRKMVIIKNNNNKREKKIYISSSTIKPLGQGFAGLYNNIQSGLSSRTRDFAVSHTVFFFSLQPIDVDYTIGTI